MSGAVLLVFAGSWAAIGLLSTRWSDQPQRWAAAPAISIGLSGLGLLALSPSATTLDRLAWVWPPAVLAGVVWLVTRARRDLHSHSRRWLLYPLFGALALAALGGGYETVRESFDRTAYPMPGQLIDVGGYRLHLSCTGSGGPTVILEGGFGEISPSWAWIAPDVATDTRVCVYDRAGMGWSEPAGAPQDGAAIAGSLRTLLDRAHEPGPYVLVGHSSGGTYVLNFAALFPDDVAGVVLLDSMHPEQYTRLPGYPTIYQSFRRVSTLMPPLARIGAVRLINQAQFGDLPATERAQLRALWSPAGATRSQRDEWAMIPTTLIQAHALTTLADRPLMVVTAGSGMQDGWMALQEDLTTLSSSAVHRVVEEATHASLLEDEASAAISSEAIRDLVATVRQAQ